MARVGAGSLAKRTYVPNSWEVLRRENQNSDPRVLWLNNGSFGDQINFAAQLVIFDTNRTTRMFQSRSGTPVLVEGPEVLRVGSVSTSAAYLAASYGLRLPEVATPADPPTDAVYVYAREVAGVNRIVAHYSDGTIHDIDVGISD